MLLDKAEFVTFHKPLEILISRHYPGYRMFDLVGAGADEALGQLLSRSLDTDDALEDFRHVLSSPEIANNVTTTLFPRVSTPLRRGKYSISEHQLGDVVADVLSSKTSDPNVITAVAYVFTKVFSHMELVLPDPNKKIVATASSLALSMDDMKRIVMLESLRMIFSDESIKAFTSSLNQDATPVIIAEVIGRLLRYTSQQIPQVRLKLEQLSIVQSVIQMYYRDPTQLSNTVKASSALGALSTYSNFLADAVGQKALNPPAEDNSDIAAACTSILTTLQSAASIEVMSLSKFVDYFGVVPCSAPDGIYRGVVMYLAMAQTSKLDVVDSYPTAIGAELALIPTEYVPATTIASNISSTVLRAEAFEGLANLVADEISNASYSLDDTPVLRTIGVSQSDLVYLAMAKAEATAVVKGSDSATGFGLVYAGTVQEQWRTRLGAATPTVAYFNSPSSILVYSSGGSAFVPSSLPARSQSVDLTTSMDLLYLGDRDFLVDSIERPFSFDITLDNPKEGEEDLVLKCRVSMLELLVGKGTTTFSRGGASYAAVREPGVDRDLAIALSLATAYAGSNIDLVSDKAKSWIVEVMTPLVTHPAVVRLAVKALNEAILREGLDGRRYAPQYKQALVRAYFATLLGMLNRFGKIDSTLVEELMTHLPVSSLTVRAALSLASMPTALNAEASLP
jgi:hypothetical protein